MRDSTAAMERSHAAIERGAKGVRPPVILQLGPRDFSVLVWVRDEGDTPVYRVAQTGIKAAKLAATLAGKLQKEASR